MNTAAPAEIKKGPNLGPIDNALSSCLAGPVIIEPAQTTTANSVGSIQDELEILFEESAALANRLKKNARLLHRNDNLSASGRILLQTLQLHGPMTVPQLGVIRSTSRQNIQVLADRLEASGHIAFVPNPNHKRSVLVALTDAGRTLLASANARESALIGAILPGTAAAKLREAAELLRKLRYQLGGAPRQRKKPASRRAGVQQETAMMVEPQTLVTSSTTRPSQIVEVEEELPVSLL